MAEKQKRKNELANPEGANNMSGVVAEGRVAKEEKLSFDERTRQTTPYLKEDGTQDNGSEFNADNIEVVEPSIVTPEEPKIEEKETKKENKKKGKK